MTTRNDDETKDDEMRDEYDFTDGVRNKYGAEWTVDAMIADIRANGQRVPIVMQGTRIIDGRKRLAACDELRIDAFTLDLDDLDPARDADAAAATLAILREHFLLAQRAVYAAMTVTASSGVGRKSGAVGANAAAPRFGVSADIVKKARLILADGHPTVIGLMLAGRLSVRAAWTVVREHALSAQPAAAQAIVARVAAVSHEPWRRERPEKPERALLAREVRAATAHYGNTGKADVRADRPQPRAVVEQFALAVDKIDVGADILVRHANAAAATERAAEFAVAIRRARYALTQAIWILEGKAAVETRGGGPPKKQYRSFGSDQRRRVLRVAALDAAARRAKGQENSQDEGQDEGHASQNSHTIHKGTKR